MCGRFSLFAPRNDVEERFGVTFVAEHVPRYNAAPSQELAVVPDAASATIRRAEWGLVPAWADDRDDGGHINARGETAADAPTFEAAFAGCSRSAGSVDDGAWETASAGRCLVPADGFYEWGDAGDGRRPHRIELADRELFAMAGLWTRWTPKRRQAALGEFAGQAADPEPIHTFAVVTTAANDAVGAIHDRMPVVLDPGAEATWLAGDVDDARSLIEPYDGPTEVYAVSDDVNDPGNDSAAVVEPADG